MKKIWITGAKGHVGTALCAMLDGEKYLVLPTDLAEVDITDSAAVAAFARRNAPDVIINCAGLSSAAACEEDPDRAFLVNAVGVRNLAVQAQRIGAKMIQISTDDVFDREADTPYNEFDTPAPATVYGRSKLAGEEFLARLCTRHVILRSSWVYGIGQDFVDAVLAAAHDAACPWLAVPTDVIASPTSAAELAMAVLQFVENDCLGVYHAVCPGWCSRYDFAREILRCAHMEDKLALHPIHSEDGVVHYSVLDNMMLRIEGLRQPKPWREALREYIERSGGLE